MKICHICTGYPISFQGGITNYVRSLANYQVKIGHEVWVLTNPDDKQHEFQVQVYKSNKIIPFSYMPLNDKCALEEIKRFFEEKKFDIIHIHMMLDIDWDLYTIIKPYKYIISLHDYYYLCPRIQMVTDEKVLCDKYSEENCSKCISLLNTNKVLNAVETRMRKKMNVKLPKISQDVTKERYCKFKALLENADMLLPVSNRVQEIYEESNIKGKYRMLHIGNITADNFKQEFEFDMDKQKIDIAMMGTLMYMKGADIFLELAKRLDRERVTMNFYGRSASYAEKLKEVGIVDHGPYTQADLPLILANTDLGCVLSVWEDNGPQVVMEFLNNHVPVIGTRMGGIPDFINEKNGFLFNPYSKEELDALVEKINGLTREQIFEMKKSIKPTTTTKQHCEDMEQVYRTVLN